MPGTAEALVLDTWAVIAFLEDEPLAQRIGELLADALKAGIPIYMTVVNLGEVWYTIARELSEEEADSSIKELINMRIQLIDADWELTRHAAGFKAKWKMSYADCFAAALAELKKAELVTGDREYQQLEDQVHIHWV